MPLYHYCPNKAFLSIVSERKIRLTDLSHSNDLLEGKWVRNIISEICGENDVSIKNTKKILERFDVLARILTAGAFCLSRKEDLLSQWISYANKARGVSIGFNEKYLEKLVNSQPLEHFRLGLENVIYEHKIQKELITPGVKEIIKFVNDGALNQGRFGLLTPQEDLVKKYEAANERLIETVIDFLPFLYQIKNPAFSEEKEERLVSIIFKNMIFLLMVG
ncbi:MAG: DUF2971 domain-containing protein [Proteobacteria bacterium]|nr:DUF2971 domain-containing protein [Pseudomonadota bacterium]